MAIHPSNFGNQSFEAVEINPLYLIKISFSLYLNKMETSSLSMLNVRNLNLFIPNVLSDYRLGKIYESIDFL